MLGEMQAVTVISSEKKDWKYSVKKHRYFYTVCHQGHVVFIFIFTVPNNHLGMACQIIS